MRPLLFFLTLASLSPFVGAASNGADAQDLTDDQAFTLAQAPGLCHAPMTDITRASLLSEGGTLSARLAVLDASDASFSCDNVLMTVGPVSGIYGLSISLPSTDPLWGGYLDLRAMRGVGGEEGCGYITLPDGWYTDECLGAYARAGDVLSWSIPLQGRATFHEPVLGLYSEVRDYDLTGLTGDARASTSARLPYPQYANSFVGLYDSLDVGEITL